MKLTRRTGSWPPAARAALGGEQRADQDQGGNFLGRGLDGVTLQEVGLPHLPFHFAEIQLVFPALGVELGEFESGRRPHIDQTRPQSQLVGAMPGTPDADANLADLEPVENAGGECGADAPRRGPAGCHRPSV